jgi:hypothetical protein
LARAAEYPVGYHIGRTTAARRHNRCAGRQHKSKRHRLHSFHPLTEQNKPVAQFMFVDFLFHISIHSAKVPAIVTAISPFINHQSMLALALILFTPTGMLLCLWKK